MFKKFKISSDDIYAIFNCIEDDGNFIVVEVERIEMFNVSLIPDINILNAIQCNEQLWEEVPDKIGFIPKNERKSNIADAINRLKGE